MDDHLSDSEEMVTAIDDVTTEEDPQEAIRPSSMRKMYMKSADEETEPAEAAPLTPLVRHGRSNSETPPMQTKKSSCSESERSRRSRSIGESVWVGPGLVACGQ